MKRLLYALLLLTGWAMCPNPCVAQASGADESVIRPGDMLQIRVWRKPELSGEFLVASDGSVSDPFYSDVKVSGLTASAATQRIREYVARIETSPRVWVEPLFRVIVGGEVRKPDLYNLRRETTLVEAIAQAGGPTELGRLDRVRVIRRGEVLSVDIADPASALARSPVQSGDQILIPRRRNLLRESIAPISSIAAAAASVVGLVLLLSDDDPAPSGP